MVDTLSGRFPGEPRDRIQAEVMTFVRALEDRGLLVIEEQEEGEEEGGQGGS